MKSNPALLLILPALLMVGLIAASPPTTPDDGVAINVMDYIDDMSNAGPGIQAALDAAVRPPDDYYYPESGGRVVFPRGTYIVRSTITIPACGNLHLQGSGGPWGASRPCVIEYRGEGALFKFAAGSGSRGRHNGFAMSNIALRGKGRVQMALRYPTDRTFSEGFTFTRCNFLYWDKVLHVTKTVEKTKRMGFVRFVDCEAHDNKQFIDARDGRINMLRIRDSYVSRNKPDDGDYVIHLQSPNNVIIDGCCLEGQPRVLSCRDGSGISVNQCYWEGQTGDDPTMYFYDCRGIDIGMQHYHRFESDSDTWIQLDECEEYRIAPTVGGVRINKAWEWRG